MYEVFWRIFAANTVAHVHRHRQVRSGHRQHVYVAVFMTRVADQLSRAQQRLLQRLLGGPVSHVVHWCVTHSRRGFCSEL